MTVRLLNLLPIRWLGLALLVQSGHDLTCLVRYLLYGTSIMLPQSHLHLHLMPPLEPLNVSINVNIVNHPLLIKLWLSSNVYSSPYHTSEIAKSHDTLTAKSSPLAIDNSSMSLDAS